MEVMVCPLTKIVGSADTLIVGTIKATGQRQKALFQK
jgi:hypothetical protein